MVPPRDEQAIIFGIIKSISRTQFNFISLRAFTRFVRILFAGISVYSPWGWRRKSNFRSDCEKAMKCGSARRVNNFRLFGRKNEELSFALKDDSRGRRKILLSATFCAACACFSFLCLEQHKFQSNANIHRGVGSVRSRKETLFCKIVDKNKKALAEPRLHVLKRRLIEWAFKLLQVSLFMRSTNVN